MQAVLMLTGALLSPLACLGLLFWLAHLEETLPRDVQRARRTPDPPPILAVPVRTPPTGPTQAVLVPEQRPAPVLEGASAEEALSP